MFGLVGKGIDPGDQEGCLGKEVKVSRRTCARCGNHVGRGRDLCAEAAAAGGAAAARAPRYNVAWFGFLLSAAALVSVQPTEATVRVSDEGRDTEEIADRVRGGGQAERESERVLAARRDYFTTTSPSECPSQSVKMSSPDRHRKSSGGSSSGGGSGSKDNGSGICSSCMQANGSDGAKTAFGGGGGFSNNNNNNNNNNNGYSSASGGGVGDGGGSGGVPPIHVTAKVLFGSVSAISALNAERKKKT